MAAKVNKGQISDGTISKNTCIEDYHLCGKFHGFMKKCTIFGLCRYTTTIIIIIIIIARPRTASINAIYKSKYMQLTNYNFTVHL